MKLFFKKRSVLLVRETYVSYFCTKQQIKNIPQNKKFLTSLCVLHHNVYIYHQEKYNEYNFSYYCQNLKAWEENAHDSTCCVSRNVTCLLWICAYVISFIYIDMFMFNFFKMCVTAKSVSMCVWGLVCVNESYVEIFVLL